MAVAGVLESAVGAAGSFLDRLVTGTSEPEEGPRLDPTTFATPSGRLLVRPPAPSDRRAIERIYRDDGNRAAHGWSDSTVDELVRELSTPRRFKGLARSSLVGVRRDTYDVIGMTTLRGRRSANDRLGVSIGLSTLPEHRGQGLAIELLATTITAARAHVAAAGRDSQIPVWVGTATTNEAVQAMMSSLGYRPEADSEPYTAPDGQTFDAYWYQVGLDAEPPRFVPRPHDDPGE